MEISQSHFQSIITRAFDTIANLFWYVVITIVIGLFFHNSFDTTTIIINLSLLVLTFVLASFMFALFVPKPYRRLNFSKDGLDFYTFDRVRSVKWEQILGYKVTKLFPHRFIILIDGFENIEFGYYSFSSCQRREIKKMIDENSQQKY